jgi:DNA-binding CsgD family transcriptional regulator
MNLNRIIILFISFLVSITVNCQEQHTLQSATDLLLNGDLKKASKVIDSLLNTDVSLSDRGYLKLRKATIFRMKGNNQEFLKELDTVFIVAKKIDNKILEADALIQKVTYLNGKKGQALSTMAKYVAIAEETKNSRLLYNANVALTSFSLKGKDPKKAKVFFKKAVKADQENRNSAKQQYHLDLMYANILNQEEKYDSAIFYLKKALLKTTALNKKPNQAQILSILGKRALDNKNFEKSFDWSLQSQQLAKEINIRLFIESSYANMFLLLIEVEKTNALILKEKIYTFFNASSFKNALKTVEEELSEFKKNDQNLKLLKGLSEGYKILGDAEKALYYTNEWSQKNIKKLEQEQLNINNLMTLELEISKLNKEKDNLEIENKLNITQKTILFLSIILLLILGLFIWSQQRLKIKDAKLVKLSIEKNLLIATKKGAKLEETLKERELELNSFIRDMIEKNSQLEILNQKLKNSNALNYDKIKTEFSIQKSDAADNWITFMFKFDQLYPNFTKKLRDKIINISPTETKLSVLTLLNLSSKEIGSLLGISATSVNQGKYRLKKKIGLKRNISLNDFLLQIQSNTIDN